MKLIRQRILVGEKKKRKAPKANGTKKAVGKTMKVKRKRKNMKINIRDPEKAEPAPAGGTMIDTKGMIKEINIENQIGIKMIGTGKIEIGMTDTEMIDIEKIGQEKIDTGKTGIERIDTKLTNIVKTGTEMKGPTVEPIVILCLKVLHFQLLRKFYFKSMFFYKILFQQCVL